MEGMVEVQFLPGGAVVWVRPGVTLLAASEAAGLDLLTGCTQGMCGTDPVRIVAGAELLDPPEAHERGTLERMGLGEEFRLSCSARLTDGGQPAARVIVELGEF